MSASRDRQRAAVAFSLSCLLVLLILVPASLADAYDPPPSYYNTATGAGATLKSQLHDIIDGHTVYSYDAARTILQVTDADPNSPGRILLAYNRASVVGTWDSGATWNREHTWPRSLGVGTSGADNSDLHQLRPADPSLNSSRNNLNFGGAFGGSYGRVSDGGTKWYPGDADAGMIARQQFYMAVRYDGSDANTVDLELVTGNPGSGNTLGDLNRLIEWHYAATPDDFERRRNQVIYDSYQHNRNPFVDRPEYVWSVFVDQQNDSQLGFVGGTTGSDGVSHLELDLGAAIVGGAGPATSQVTLQKQGDDGTYYSVTTDGLATSSVTGRYNAFRTGGPGSQALTVGLDVSTASAGVTTGSVLVDNLDITTQGGTGRGANDGDDLLELSFTVFDHANASFAAAADTGELVLDFGTVQQGESVSDLTFDLHNLMTASGYVADLEIDGISALGDVGAFALGLDPDATVSGGASLQVAVSMATSVAGVFEATYNLLNSDIDLSGAAAGDPLSLTVRGVVVVPEPGTGLIVLVLLALRRRRGRGTPSF